MVSSEHKKRLLIVSPSFPPINAPDMQRVRMSLSYYHEYGWEPVVLTIDPVIHGGSREDELTATVPANVVVHRCGALSMAWSRRLGTGNIGLRAWFPLLFAGARIIRREKIDLIFFSNSQFATFPLGRLWSAWFGVPYVLDIQDPWRTDYYEKPGAPRPPGGWKYRLARAQAALLEGWSLRCAAAIMAVSEQYLETFRGRYPWFARKPTDVIRFGASENDLTAATALTVARPRNDSLPLRLVYTGVVGTVMHTALRTFFSGLKRFREQNPDLAGRLRCEFIGTSYAHRGASQPSVIPLAEAFGLADMVTERVDRLGHLECLRIQAKASALLLLGSDDNAYSPSKLYPYYLSGRPMLSVVLKNSPLENILRELNCSALAVFGADVHNLPEEAQIATFLSHVTNGFPASALPARNEELFRREYLAPSLTARQCALFDRAIAHDRR